LNPWKDSELDLGESDNDEETEPDNLKREGQKNIEFATRVALEACVIPKLGKGKGELDPALLDDADLLFIVDWATSPAGSLPMKGGGAMPVASLDRFPKRSRKRSGTIARG
jgi:hypothetical protein